MTRGLLGGTIFPTAMRISRNVAPRGQNTRLADLPRLPFADEIHETVAPDSPWNFSKRRANELTDDHLSSHPFPVQLKRLRQVEHVTRSFDENSRKLCTTTRERVQTRVHLKRFGVVSCFPPVLRSRSRRDRNT